MASDGELVTQAADHADKVLPEPIANGLIARMDHLMMWHRRDPRLLDYDGKPSYKAEAEGIARTILAMPVPSPAVDRETLARTVHNVWCTLLPQSQSCDVDLRAADALLARYDIRERGETA